MNKFCKIKKFLALVLMAAILLSLEACNHSPTNDNESISPTTDKSQNTTEVPNQELDDANAPISEEPTNDDESIPSTTDESQNTTEVPNQELDDANAPILSVGEVISDDDKCEFYLDYVNITNDVLPPSHGSAYAYYEADEGKVYVDVCIAYKNLGTRNITADEVMTGKLIYGGKYEYNGFSMVEEDNRSDFTFSSIASISPLSTEYVHYLFSVPEEVQTSENTVDVLLMIAGIEYKVIVKEGTNTGN